MATSITLSGSLAWAQAFCGWRPLNIGVNNEPAITSMNLIIQTILGPPFTWNWNRGSTTWMTTAGTQDYAESASTFGFIEKAYFQIPAATITNTALTANVATITATNSFQAGDIVVIVGTTNGSGVLNGTFTIVSASSSQFTFNLTTANVTSGSDTGTATVGNIGEVSQVTNVLSVSSIQGPPANIAALLDNNSGTITFRLMPIPDRVYSVGVIWQNRIPSLVSSLSGTWAPIPDHYSFIYQPGFLALMLAYAGDPRAQIYSQLFTSRLLATAEGLSEEQKNMFMQTWLMQMNVMQATPLMTQQGYQGRGSGG